MLSTAKRGWCPTFIATAWALAWAIVRRAPSRLPNRRASEHVARLEVQRSKPAEHACPGSTPQSLKLPLLSPLASPGRPGTPGVAPSDLANWPIQLRLVPADAAFLRQADVVLVADCVPFAYADLQREIVRGRPLVIGCPKLDETAAHVEKLAAILSIGQIRGLSIVRMEVPCCAGLVRIAEAAQQLAGRTVPIEEIVITLHGQRTDSGH
jgi:hypothetical protein